MCVDAEVCVKFQRAELVGVMMFGFGALPMAV